jgi:hypothetical protein
LSIDEGGLLAWKHREGEREVAERPTKLSPARLDAIHKILAATAFDTIPSFTSSAYDQPRLTIQLYIRGKPSHLVEIYGPAHYPDGDERRRFAQVWNELIEFLPRKVRNNVRLDSTAPSTTPVPSSPASSAKGSACAGSVELTLSPSSAGRGL